MAGFRPWQRYISVAIVLLIFVYAFSAYHEPALRPPTKNPWSKGSTGASGASEGGAGLGGDSSSTTHPPSKGGHPIDKLIRDARLHHKMLLEKRSTTLEQAASRYRERRGRHPPPGFDAWFKFAQEHDAIIVEEYFDRIHHDIHPLWALDPRQMRRQTHTQPQLIRVRNGKSEYITDNPNRPPWIQNWWEMLVSKIEQYLPDLDMVVNVMDETRLLVPWEKVATYVKTEKENRRFTPVDQAISEYSGLADVEAAKEPYEHSWIKNDANKFWDYLRVSCPPDSPSKNVTALPHFRNHPEFPSQPGPYTYKGYIQNYTASQDPCIQPHLRSMHGTFTESISMSTSHDLLPMFAGCKLPQNNEILIPGAMYLTKWDFYSGGETHGGEWRGKKDGMVWRGTGSGGRNKEDNWSHFQRHRFVQMMNGTVLSMLERGDNSAAATFDMPPRHPYDVPAQAAGRLGEWVSGWSNVGFNDLECFPQKQDENGKRLRGCGYTEPFFRVAETVPMKEQYDYKFLPDVDGNSYSARWRGFLRSTSVPLKGTIYAEWHDDRFIPWVHFVPFDSSFMDMYGLMDYFLSHDAEAETIAAESREWAESVFRDEDMWLYVWRLLLEYARVVDDKRERLAFVADLRS
jgi:hypothetical protein